MSGKKMDVMDERAVHLHKKSCSFVKLCERTTCNVATYYHDPYPCEGEEEEAATKNPTGI